MAEISITYCKPCGYERRATDAAAALQRELNVAVKLVAGTGGVFDVKVDGRTVAAKTAGHFPEYGDIVAAVSRAMTGA